jgi:hypothetical protein
MIIPINNYLVASSLQLNIFNRKLLVIKKNYPICFVHSSDILSIRFKHTRILRFFGLLRKYLKILDTKANFQAFVFL